MNNRKRLAYAQILGNRSITVLKHLSTALFSIFCTSLSTVAVDIIARELRCKRAGRHHFEKIAP